MFEYKEFKRKMKNRGHSVWKHGNYIEIKPDNNIFGYGKGFINAYDIVQGFEDSLKFVSMVHFNSWVYSVRFRIV